MKALILTADGVEDSELLYPYYRLLEEKIDVDIAAPEARTVTGKHGYTVDANMAFADVDAEAYDLLVLPGGKGPETVRLDQNAVRVARQMLQADKVVAAICHGPQVLVSAGGLEGRRATCWAGIRDDVRAAGADYEDREVVVDQKLITSRCPSDLPAFCREILAALSP
ncbi:MAG: type 1 glutamine amidotransferase domain-containing protein [bacterium]